MSLPNVILKKSNAVAVLSISIAGPTGSLNCMVLSALEVTVLSRGASRIELVTSKLVESVGDVWGVVVNGCAVSSCSLSLSACLRGSGCVEARRD